MCVIEDKTAVVVVASYRSCFKKSSSFQSPAACLFALCRARCGVPPGSVL